MAGTITPLQAIILGIVQGATEFFPVSSSAHLALFRKGMGIEGDYLFFDLVCHLGTWLALIVFLRPTLLEILHRKKEEIFPLFLALLPLLPAYFLLKPLRVALSDPSYMGYCLCLSGLWLWGSCQKGRRKILATESGISSEKGKKTFHKTATVLCIGIAQAVALIPGISRSGLTIGTARLFGWSWVQGAKFSFLLSIPAIFGGLVLESARIAKGSQKEPWFDLPLSLGFLTSFIVGSLAVRFVFWMYEKQKVLPFALYCLGIAWVAWILFHEGS